MVQYVHKKIPMRTVQSFQESCERLNGESIEWYEDQEKIWTKHQTVTTTYWKKQGTLMFQGRGESVTMANELFLEHKETKEEECLNLETNNEQQSKRKKPNEQDQKEIECERGRSSNTATVSKNQITQLHQFILNWGQENDSGAQLILPEQLQANQDTYRGSTMQEGIKRAIKDFKRDLLAYLNRCGLQRRNI